MKIVFIIGSAEVGGAEIATAEIAAALKKLGLDVRVVFLHRGGATAGYLERSNVPYVVCSDNEKRTDARRGLQILHGLGRLTNLARALRSFRPDVVHAMLPGAVAYGLMVSRLVQPNCTRIAGIHGHEEWDGWSKGLVRNLRPMVLVSRWLYKRELRKSTAVTVVSDSVGQFAVSNLNVSPHKMHCIPNGVNITDRKSDVSITPATIINVANFRPVKGHRTLLKALGLVHTPAEAKLLGQASAMRDELMSEYQEFSGPVQITFLPPNSDPITEMLTAQVGVLASHSEGMPLALLEMMSVGLPIVATDVGGIPDLVSDKENGFLVGVGDYAGMAKAIQTLLVDPALRLKFGNRSREIVQELDWKYVSEQYFKLYDSLT